MRRVLLLCALFLLAFTPAQAQGRTAQEVVDGFVAAGLPVTGVVAYTEETDVNHQLGRPNGYIEKVSWQDTRIRTSSTPEAPGVDDGGSIERFANLRDMNLRYDYLEAVAVGTLFGEYRFRDDANFMILRLSLTLVPSAANEYGAAFTGS